MSTTKKSKWDPSDPINHRLRTPLGPSILPPSGFDGVDGDLRRIMAEDSPLEAPVGGHARTNKVISLETREMMLKSRRPEIEAFAEDRGLDPTVVFGVAEASMRLGRVPDLRQYGFAGDDALAVKHFMAGEVLNIAIEQQENTAPQQEGTTSGNVAPRVIDPIAALMSPTTGMLRRPNTIVDYTAHERISQEQNALGVGPSLGVDQDVRSYTLQDLLAQPHPMADGAAGLMPEGHPAARVDGKWMGEASDDHEHDAAQERHAAIKSGVAGLKPEHGILATAMKHLASHGAPSASTPYKVKMSRESEPGLHAKLSQWAHDVTKGGAKAHDIPGVGVVMPRTDKDDKHIKGHYQARFHEGPHVNIKPHTANFHYEPKDPDARAALQEYQATGKVPEGWKMVFGRLVKFEGHGGKKASPKPHDSDDKAHDENWPGWAKHKAAIEAVKKAAAGKAWDKSIKGEQAGAKIPKPKGEKIGKLLKGLGKALRSPAEAEPGEFDPASHGTAPLAQFDISVKEWHDSHEAEADRVRERARRLNAQTGGPPKPPESPEARAKRLNAQTGERHEDTAPRNVLAEASNLFKKGGKPPWAKDSDKADSSADSDDDAAPSGKGGVAHLAKFQFGKGGKAPKGGASKCGKDNSAGGKKARLAMVLAKFGKK